MISNQFKRLMLFMILHQVIIGYLGSVTNQSAYAALNSHMYLIGFAAISEVVSDVVRIISSWLVPKIGGNSLISKIYFIASLFGLLSGIFFCLCLSYRYDIFYYISWIINRIAFGFTAAIRDLILYRLLYLDDKINIPMVKSFKGLGTVMAAAHVIFVPLFSQTTAVLILFNSVLNFIIACFCYKQIRVSNLFNKDISEKVKKEEIPDISLSSEKRLLKGSSTVSEITEARFCIKDLLALTLVSLIMSMSSVPEQLIYFFLEAKYATIAKGPIGQTLLGFAYSIILRNSVYAVAIYPLVTIIAYCLFFFSSKYALFIAAMMIGLTIQIQNSIYTILPRSFAEFNGIYLSATILSFAIGKLISSLFFNFLMVAGMQQTKILKIMINYGLVSFIINMILLVGYLNYKKRIKSKENTIQ